MSTQNQLEIYRNFHKMEVGRHSYVKHTVTQELDQVQQSRN